MKAFEKRQVQAIARERVSILFDLAGKEWKAHPERSIRYVELARRIGERYNLRIHREFKGKYCKKCGCYWVLGESVKVRSNPKTKSVEYACLACGAKKRFGYSEKRGVGK